MGAVKVWIRWQAIAALVGVRVDQLLALGAAEVQRRLAERVS